MANPSPDAKIYHNGHWYRNDGTDATQDYYMASTLAGEKVQVDRTGAGPLGAYTSISTATTAVVKTGACVFYGVLVVTGGAGSTVTAYDNTAASGTKLIDAAASATSGVFLGGWPQGLGLLCVNGLTIVTTATAPVILVLTN